MTPEIVVVDSGSTDGTVQIAETWADKVVHIPAGSFSYGRALNVGADAASSRIHAALSAHCLPPSTTWLADSLERYRREDVAATAGQYVTPYGSLITDTYYQRLSDVRTTSIWGFSNHGSTWSAEVWLKHPFREDLEASEDKEWSWRVLADGYVIAYAPDLAVHNTHRRRAGFPELCRRMARETRSMVSLGAATPLSAGGAARAWWSALPMHRTLPAAVIRVNPFRAAELAAVWWGGRTTPSRPDAPLRVLMAESGLDFEPRPFVPRA